MVVFKTIVPRYRLLGAWSLGDFWARLFQEEVCTLNRPSALNGLPRRPGWQLPEISRPDRGVSSPSSSLPTLSLSLSFSSPHRVSYLIYYKQELRLPRNLRPAGDLLRRAVAALAKSGDRTRHWRTPRKSRPTRFYLRFLDRVRVNLLALGSNRFAGLSVKVSYADPRRCATASVSWTTTTRW